jgi:hypothetical protein
MTDTIAGYLIDAKAGTIRPVTLHRKNRLKSIYAHLDCDCIDIVNLAEDHIVYCDDNGLRDGLQCFTDLAGFPNPLPETCL